MNELDISILQLERWISLGESEQDHHMQSIDKFLGKPFEHLYTQNYSGVPGFRIPTFMHKASGIEMNLIFGDEYLMGVTEEEREALKQIDPKIAFADDTLPNARSVRVQPFLAGRLPILDSTARQYLEIDDFLFRPEFSQNRDDLVPVYLTRDEVDVLCNEFDLTLPSEAQWEYMFRGKTHSAFPFGNSIPGYDRLDEEILLSHFNDKDVCDRAANVFGLLGLHTGDWCSDSFFGENKDPNSDLEKVGEAPFVYRGGAAISWPWQDCGEWTFCIAAARWSSEYLEDGTCGGRFVKRINFA